MSILIQQAGVQTTVQSSPRRGLRHKGVPSGGAADPLSFALANRLLDQALDAPAFEITLSEAKFRFLAPARFAVTGGECDLLHNASRLPMHETNWMPGDGELTVRPKNRGARIYLAVETGLSAASWLRSKSTCIVTKVGGHEGRSLKTGDIIDFAGTPRGRSQTQHIRKTPAELRPHIGQSWVLRAVDGPELDQLRPADQRRLYAEPFVVSQRISRIGAELAGANFSLTDDGRMPSAAVFSGTVQCPPSGAPYLLMCDAGTTGGYPRLAQIIRADRHMLGQLRPGDKIQLRQTTPEKAVTTFREKTELLRTWLGDAFELG